MGNLNDRTLTIKKTFDAPIDVVWQAWTKPEHLAKWWVPSGMEIKIIAHDFREGGKWKYEMLMPDGNMFVSEGTYMEIVEFEKIITSADFRPMTHNVELQCFFKAEGDKTIFIFNVVHETAEYCKQQEEMGFYNGWGSAFERLEKLVVKK
ncbi:SRPBCC family protein [Flavobacteriaceae bacterium GF1]